MFEALHAERNLTLEHWRYRLLHWTFGLTGAYLSDGKVRWKDSDGDSFRSPLPEYLYTHYCPLFHLTNALVLASPLVSLVRFFIAVAKAAEVPAERLAKGVNWLWAQYRKWRPAAPVTPEAIDCWRVQRRLRFWTSRATLSNEDHVPPDTAFKLFWNEVGPAVGLETKDAWEARFTAAIAKYRETMAAVDVERAARRERILHVVQVSRRVFRVIVWLHLMALVGFAAYLAGTYGPGVAVYVAKGVWSLATFLVTLGWMNLLYGVGVWALSAVVILVLIGAIVLAVRKSGFDFEPIGDAMKAPFVGVGHAARGTGSFIKNAVYSIFDFFGMFYEENCPPVTIVAQEDK